MKILQFNSREDWGLFRAGKLSGSKVKDLVVKRGDGEKKGFYELIAERLATRPEWESPMMRGQRIEDEALTRFEKETGKTLNKDLVVWQDPKIKSLIISPDGFVEGEKITEAVECKCLNSANHVEVLLKQKVPKDHEEQVKWYFVINPDLETLYMCFYDPRMVVKDFFYLTVKRSDFLENELDNLRAEMLGKLERIDEIVASLIKGSKLDF